MQETVRFFSSLAVGRKFELVSVITPEALPILGDRIQLQQVILNLVMNGIDAMRDTPNENRTISIRTSRVENFAQLSVSDRGPGIPEDKLKEVFEPFFTSKAEGMGMGLSIARTIIEAHNGRHIGQKSGSRRCVVPDQASALYRRRWIGIGLATMTFAFVLMMPPKWTDEKLNAVFEPFFTSKAEGMGMGLSIARTIIEAHNGVVGQKP